MGRMAIRVGTSGWVYRDWRGDFYPDDVPQRRWLEHYATRFATVEVNNAFYRLPEASTFAAWAERTPDDFVMVVKASRFLTHIKRLKDPEEPVARFVERAAHLGGKLGPVLLQLPPTMRCDPERLDHALAQFPPDWRLAVEFRHETRFTDETRAVLEGRRAAFCLADSPRRRTPVWRTTDWCYLRLHEGTGSPHPCYTPSALDKWATRLAELHRADAEVFVFFNNDPTACAVRNAREFAGAATAAGLVPTRVPAAGEVRV